MWSLFIFSPIRNRILFFRITVRIWQRYRFSYTSSRRRFFSATRGNLRGDLFFRFCFGFLSTVFRIIPCWRLNTIWVHLSRYHRFFCGGLLPFWHLSLRFTSIRASYVNFILICWFLFSPSKHHTWVSNSFRLWYHFFFVAIIWIPIFIQLCLCTTRFVLPMLLSISCSKLAHSLASKYCFDASIPVPRTNCQVSRYPL